MRILFLTHRLPYAPNRGDRIRSFYLMREMSRFAEVSLFSLAHDDDEMSHRGEVPFAHHVSCLRAHRLPNLLRGSVRLATDRPLTHSLLDAREARATLETLVRTRPPDLIVAFCSGMARFVFEPPLAGRPFVLDMVDVDSVKWDQLAKATRSPLGWIYRREARTLAAFEAVAATRARTTLVVNDRERLALQEIAPAAHVTVLPVGIDVDSFRPPDPPTGTPTVIFCGVMSYQPNALGVSWFATQVWPRVRAVVPDAKFVVVGSAPTPAVRNLAVQDSSVEIVGEVPTVQPHLWQAAVSVAPLHFGRGLQTKVLEALAAGLPVVITPEVESGLPPDVRRACVTASDPQAFASAVIALLQMAPEDRRRAAAAAPLSSLNWTEQLRDLESILRRGLSESGAARSGSQTFRHSHS